MAIFTVNEQTVLNKQVQSVVKALNGLPPYLKNKRIQVAARKAARPVRDAAKQLTPVGKKIHFRYEKRVGKKKAKGEGRIKATYNKGHLRKAMQILSLKRAKAAVYVGPKFDTAAARAGGRFGFAKTKVDGYYAHMVFGSAKAFRKRVMDVALNATRSQVVQIFNTEITKEVQKYKIKGRL